MEEIGCSCVRADYGNWEAVESVTEILENILSRLPVTLLLSIPLGDFKYLLVPKMISSFDGLICCTYFDMVDLEIRICNPVTQEISLLPKCSPSAWSSVGLAFDPENKEYHVYNLYWDVSDPEDEYYACEVYSSKAGPRREIGRVDFHPMNNICCPLMTDHVYVGGKVYWSMSLEQNIETPESILSVDKNDVFRKISLPCEVTAWSFLIDLKGSLSLVTLDETEEHIHMEFTGQ